MRAALLAFVASSATAYYQPGDPPQCFDEYQCIFSRFPTATGLSSQYIWDLTKLCQGAGSEFVARRDPTCVVDDNGICPSRCYDCNPDKRIAIRFNVCGTVSGPLAPVKEENCPAGDPPSQCPNGVGSAQEIPIPASHGVAVQYIEGYPGPAPPAGYGPAVLPGQKYGCADIDTCDQRWNPLCPGNNCCQPGSPNYPVNAAITDSTYTRRASICNNNAAYCSLYNYWCCSVKSTPCTKQAEVVAIYDGSAPAFNLLNEGDPDGISLTSVGAPAYRDDSFPCGDVENPNDPGIDPSTLYPQQRTFTLQLSCDRNATSGILNLFYGEPSPCQYIAYGSSAYACGIKISNQTTPTPAPAPAAAAAAAAGASSATAAAGAGGFFGGVAAGVLGLLAFTHFRRAAGSAEAKPLMSGPPAGYASA